MEDTSMNNSSLGQVNDYYTEYLKQVSVSNRKVDDELEIMSKGTALMEEDTNIAQEFPNMLTFMKNIFENPYFSSYCPISKIFALFRTIPMTPLCRMFYQDLRRLPVNTCYCQQFCNAVHQYTLKPGAHLIVVFDASSDVMRMPATLFTNITQSWPGLTAYLINGENDLLMKYYGMCCARNIATLRGDDTKLMIITAMLQLTGMEDVPKRAMQRTILQSLIKQLNFKIMDGNPMITIIKSVLVHADDQSIVDEMIVT
jgi:hypothetical protein